MATLIIAMFFCFPASGATNKKTVSDTLRKKENTSSRSNIVTQEKGKRKYGLLSDEEKEEDGAIQKYGLIEETEPKKETFKVFISKEKSQLFANKLCKRIKKHVLALTGTDAELQVLQEEEFCYAVIYDRKHLPSEFYFETVGLTDDIEGFAGPVNSGIFLTKEGVIRSAHYISSHETPSYIEDIHQKGFYKLFEGVSISGGGINIDAVSGATLTTDAITLSISSAITQALNTSLQNYFGFERHDFDIKPALPKWWIAHTATIFLFFLFAIHKGTKKTKLAIILSGLLSLLFIGFYLNNPYTFVIFIKMFSGSTLSLPVWFYTFLVLLGALVWNNAYCRYVCPYGNAQKLVTIISPLKPQRFFLPNSWLTVIRFLLAAGLIIGILLGQRHWSGFELFPDLFGLNFSSWWFWVSFATVLTSLVYPMIWCRLLCPTGSLLDILTSISKGVQNLTLRKKL